MKDKIIRILRATARPGIEELIKYMEGEGGYFEAPCSTQHHLCKEGGLAEHSLNVYNFMFEIANGHNGCHVGQSNDSIAIVALLHDLGKANYRQMPNYKPNILKSGEISKAKPYETNTERLYIPHEIVSLQIISKYIYLTQEEEFAILYHNGLYVSSGRDISGKERPLQQLLHFADMWCSRFIEKEEE